MAKALKFFIILIFLLSGGALYLGYELYAQREVMKARTQEGENTLEKIAKNIEASTFKKANLVVETPEQLQKMKQEQQSLAAAALNTFASLKATGLDLTNTLARLDQTNAVLAQTIQTLNERVAEVAQLKDTVSQKEQEISKRDGQINELKTNVADLKQQVQDRDDKIAKHVETIKDLKDEVKADEEDIKRVEAELSACVDPTGESAYMRPGTAGRVVKVNDDWNFVILNIGTNQGAKPNARMYVHRGDKLLGRIKIAVVSKNMSIAEIERDWQQAGIQEGDYVVH